jgi:NitT/TauT family transport system substrate-binding protein
MFKKSLVAAGLALLFVTCASAAELSKVRVGHGGTQIFRLPFYIAILNGYFPSEGIELEVVETRSGSDADMMLAGNAVDFVTSQVVDTINLGKQKIHAVGVAALFNRINNSIVIPKRLVGQIKDFRDLKGRPLGITGIGSGTWQFALLMAARHQMKREDLNLIAVGAGAGVIGAVKSGRVDAMSFADPENYELVRNGDADFLLDMNEDAQHRKYIGDSYLFGQIFTLADFARRNPEVVQGVVNAIQRGINWLQSHNAEEVTELLAKYAAFSRMDRQILLALVNRSQQGWPKSAPITQDAFDNVMNVSVVTGSIDAPLPMSQLVNNSFAEKAVAKYPRNN